MELTRKLCEAALYQLNMFEKHREYIDKYIEVLEQLIKEHFDNKPLKLEEI